MTKAAVLDSSIQKTHEWLNEIAGELGFQDEQAAYAALRATLHAVRDRLPVELVAHLGAELPTMIRGIFYDGWHPSATKLRTAHDEDFCDAVRRELHGHSELQHVEQVAGAVLRVLGQHVAPGQIDHVIEALPARARRFWQGALENENIH
jgi:uncharacterized protein (DUF2267 family)